MYRPGAAREQLLVGDAERAPARAEHLPAQPRLLEHDRRVLELELRDEGVEGAVDESDPRIRGRDLEGEIAHLLHGPASLRAQRRRATG